jgi:hypothetical protein
MSFSIGSLREWENDGAYRTSVASCGLFKSFTSLISPLHSKVIQSLNFR